MHFFLVRRSAEMSGILAVLALATLAVPAAAQTALNGETLFRQRCQSCHTVAPAGKSPLGPNLRGVVGRKAAAANFLYSDALKKSGLTWDRAQLDRYLTAPTRMVPGTRMPIPVPDAGQRAAIIEYLSRTR